MAASPLSAPARLRALLQQDGMIVAPGAYDAWSARMVEKAGFSCLYMTGYGVSASTLGRPDIGLVTMKEMAETARNINQAVDIPVIADADDGYGSSLNVIRTVKEYELAGIAGIQLEDQAFPKRCGHMENKQLIPKEDMVAKIRAVVHARKNPDTVILARTDARAVNGFDDAIDRARAYHEAGADVIFFEAPESVEELRRVGEIFKGIPLLANMAEGGKTPSLSRAELGELGYTIILYPSLAIYTVTKALQENFALLKKEENNTPCMANSVDFHTFNKMIGLPEMRDLESSFTIK